MMVCVALYGVLLAGFLYSIKGNIQQKSARKHIKQVLGLLFLTNTLAMFVFFQQSIADKAITIPRNEAGDGNKKESIDIITKDNKKKAIEIEVKERVLSKKEEKEQFDKAILKLDTLILGKNKSKDQVMYDLNLIAKIPDSPIQIIWELSTYDVMNIKGELVTDNIPAEGSLVELQGLLQYRDTEVLYTTTVQVVPKPKSSTTLWIDRIMEQVKKQDEETKEDSKLVLPREIDGVQIKWQKDENMSAYGILVLGVVLSFLPMLREKDIEKQKNKHKIMQLQLNYPELLNQMILLLGAGMTIRQTFKQIGADYERESVEKKLYPAFEEVCQTNFEMQSGVSEVEAYERFGRRISLSSYMKLGVMLSQNCKKGTEGLVQILERESIQAFEERKQTAKRMGEEAGTKLLIPMFVMLAIVLVIVITPAFLSVQL